jgi:hypothetical protein
MPRYTFKLQDGTSPVDDASGIWLSTREKALEYAEAVTHELMRGREAQTRAWRLDVYEDGGVVYQISFASIDPTLDHLAPSVRMTVEASSASIRSTRETISATRATMREARALVAISRGKPYLAAEGGEPTIRSGPPPIQHEKRRKGSGA